MDARQPSSYSRERPAAAVSPAQIVALGLVAASIGWAVWLLRDRPSSEEVELLAGMALPSSEMALMEAAFDRAQLSDHRTEGGRVWVPRSRHSAYMRALVDGEALPREFGVSLRRALEKNSPWQSKAVQDGFLRVATQEELALVICSMPGIERAAVLYDVEQRPGLDGEAPAKTASVNVRTQPDMELDAARVLAIRMLVSSAIAGLAPERVAVTDLRSGRVHAGPLETAGDPDAAAIAAADPALARRIAHENHLASKVRQALSLVKGSTVNVSVEFAVPEDAVAEATPTVIDASPVPPEPPGSRPPPETSVPAAPRDVAGANTPAAIPDRMPPVPVPAAPEPGRVSVPRVPSVDVPESIHVSIAVPEIYFHNACRAAAGRPGEIAADPVAVEAREVDRIRRHVLALLPPTRDPARRQVLVTSFPAAPAANARRESVTRPSGVRETARAPLAAAAPPHGTPPHAAESDHVAGGTPSLREIAMLVAAGDFEQVPRQAWLAAMSISVGLLSAFLWWAGGRSRRGAERHLAEHPRIDWSGADESRAETGVGGLGRAAVLLTAAWIGGSVIARADDRPPLVAPLPETFVLDTADAHARPGGGAFPGVSASSTSRKPPSGAPQVLPALPLEAAASPGESAANAPGLPAAPAGRLADWKLLAVIALALGAVGAAAAVNRRRAVPLPPDVFEVLGEGTLGGPHAVRIVRFGPKTLLVSLSSGGCQTLAELTDPQATACIAAACRGSHAPLRPGASARHAVSRRAAAGAVAAGEAA